MIEKLYTSDFNDMINKINEIIDFLNDTYLMDVADGKFISSGPAIEPSVIESSLSADCCIDNMAYKVSLVENVKCPYCGESYYTEKYSMSTAVYCPPIYKDGVNINPDSNTSKTRCECLNCHKEFDI